ncbi:hypothetical protein BH23ACT10_BH23ACT10_10090 [soil metagenome]
MPEPYLRAAELLGVAPADCVVVEDAPAGVRAAQAAAMRVVAVATTHAPDALDGSTLTVGGIADLRVEATGDGTLLIELRESLDIQV